MNVEGIIGKTGTFYREAENIDPDIFCFTETWHRNTVGNSFYNNYNIHENFGIREGTTGSYKWGYIVGIKDKLKAEIVYKDNLIIIFRIKGSLFAFFYVPPDK